MSTEAKDLCCSGHKTPRLLAAPAAGTSKAAQEGGDLVAKGRKQPTRKAAAAAPAAIASHPEDPFDFDCGGGEDTKPTPGMVSLIALSSKSYW